MSLRYSFRHLFYGGKLNKRRLYEILKDLDSAEAGEGTDISALQEVVGDEDSGLVKAVADLGTNKANAEHTHTILDVSDATTTTITVTYTDDSTDTITFVVQDSS